MEIREGLLKNDIRWLTENYKTLSDQLITIRDFIDQEFEFQDSLFEPVLRTLFNYLKKRETSKSSDYSESSLNSSIQLKRKIIPSQNSQARKFPRVSRSVHENSNTSPFHSNDVENDEENPIFDVRIQTLLGDDNDNQPIAQMDDSNNVDLNLSEGESEFESDAADHPDFDIKIFDVSNSSTNKCRQKPTNSRNSSTRKQNNGCPICMEEIETQTKTSKTTFPILTQRKNWNQISSAKFVLQNLNKNPH